MFPHPVLTVNGGSSSVKLGLFTSEHFNKGPLRGQVESFRDEGAVLTIRAQGLANPIRRRLSSTEDDSGIQSFLSVARELSYATDLAAAAHRVVHGGMRLTEHQRITPEVLKALQEAQSLDLIHLPAEIRLIQAIGAGYPKLEQIVCFDTAFHREMPRVAQLFAIPRRFLEAGARRFGFHGLSYEYLMRKLREEDGAEVANGRVILMHLGSGASMAAVHKGKPIDTSMGFTPLAGLVMGTRPGDLDPGLVTWMMRSEQITPEDMEQILNRECGLVAISGGRSDMRDLVSARSSDRAAADAVDLFCYQARKYIGAFSAVLGGVDTLVFSGGIGEHAPEIRTQICDGLRYLSLEIDARRNDRNDAVISTDDSRVGVRVIATDEESVMATIVAEVLGWDRKEKR